MTALIGLVREQDAGPQFKRRTIASIGHLSAAVNIGSSTNDHAGGRMMILLSRHRAVLSPGKPNEGLRRRHKLISMIVLSAKGKDGSPSEGGRMMILWSRHRAVQSPGKPNERVVLRHKPTWMIALSARGTDGSPNDSAW